MLRGQDLLLTLGAVFLLAAALDVKRHKVIRASALESLERNESSVLALMGKIRKNLEALRLNNHAPGNQLQQQHQHQQLEKGKHQVSGDGDSNKLQQNSFNFYAHEMNQRPSDISKTQNAQEVRVDFLRSAPSLPQTGNGPQQQHQNATYLYMLNSLNYLSDDQDNELETAAQQPVQFGATPALSQNQQTNNQNFNQVLQNFQRLNPQLAQQFQNNPQAMQQIQNNPQIMQYIQNNPQILTQIQRNPQLAALAQQMLAGAGQPPQSSQDQGQFLGNLFPQPGPVATPNPQQPLSPFQLITAPFHAFQRAIAGNQQQQQQQPSAKQPKLKPTKSSTPTREAERQPQPVQPPPPPPPGLLNPFAPLPGQLQQQQQQQPAQLGNLQSLYQQSPLYQALLAARQRQEALQAADKLRQQQQLQQPQQPPFVGLLGQPQLGQSWQPNNMNANQAYGQLQPPVQQPPPPLPSLPTGPQQQPPVGANPQQVQFDDEAAQPPAQEGPPSGGDQPTGAGQQNPNPEDQGSNEQGGDNNQEEPEQQEQPQQNDDANNNNDNNNQQQEDQQQQPEQQEQPPSQANEARPAEEEDPDLKQFQNLANGGDSFTDLFPPGILSNNDISEIKKQQDDQAKKQEEEERQRYLQRQQQQQQPMGQYDNGNNNNNINQEQPDNEENNDGGGGGGGEQGEPEDDGGGGGENQESPQAAALTNSTQASKQPRFTESPGVVYN